ncbi:MAG: methyltransferase [Pseudomonadota bacterium]
MSDPAAAGLSEDHFLGGRLRLRQPLQGYRAATDPVLLAAACPAKPGQTVLDLGCGVGTAGFCLAARVPVRLSGIELQKPYAELARQNAALNGIEFTLYEGDLSDPPSELKSQVFDHVLTNPPFHGAEDLASPNAAKDLAHREALDLRAWIRAGLARVKPKGWITLIHRADRLAEILGALSETGDIAIKPLTARAGRDAKRIVVRARKGVKTPLRICAPLILHEGPAHRADAEDFTETARSILRDAAPMMF